MRCEGNSYKGFWEKVVLAIKKQTNRQKKTLMIASPPLGIIFSACDAQKYDNHLIR